MKIYALCTVEAGECTLRHIVRHGVKISGLIGLTERDPSDAISGYLFMEPIARELGIQFVGIRNYSLNDPEDRKKVEELDIDALLVLGWQRLIPAWLIKHVNYGAIGVHGSPEGISQGRGRSPQNWALILGAQTFSISIFFITEGIDSGRVINTRIFPIDREEDIASSYKKASILVGDMIVESINDGKIENRIGQPQPDTAFYLPQRLPEDGEIDWNRTSEAISRFIRALTHPYPGAFTSSGGNRVIIWRTRIFSIGDVFTKALPGQVVAVFPEGQFVVATLDGFLLVEQFDAVSMNVDTGTRFESASFKEQMRGIVARHRQKYPDLPVSKAILQTLETHE